MDRADYVGDVVVPRSSFGAHNLSEVRASVQQAADDSGLALEAVNRFVQAVGEALANAVRHGGPERWVVVRRSEDRLQAEVHDNGSVPELIIPEQAPNADQLGGRGFWLMSQMADGLELKTTGGTTVRIVGRLRRSRA